MVEDGGWGRVQAKLSSLIAPAVEALGYELVGVEFRPGHRRSLVRVYIDAEAGISLSDCERVSHQVSGILDVEDPIEGHYDLEVSSPGLDRPLFERRDFERFRGAKVRVKTTLPVAGRRNFTGVLTGCRGEAVVIVDEGEERELPLSAIGTARLVPEG